jgi:hypothetical protein
MLKGIDERYDHQGMTTTCKRIASWLHNHGQLNAMMRRGIGGEIVKWNALAAAWWMLFGRDTPQLQCLALRLVSQCV